MTHTFTVDTKLRIRSCSEELARLKGTDADQIIGRVYYEVIPRIYASNKCALRKVFAEKRAIAITAYEFPCIHSTVKADITARPSLLKDGAVKEVEVSIASITPCDIAKQYRQARQLIDIGKIASTLAHGVRNPLNAIKGAVVYLRDKYAGEQTLIEFTSIMEEEIARLEDYITRFLNTSVAPAEVESIDVNRLMEKIRTFVSLQAYAKNIQCVYEKDDLPPVKANPFHLEQALLNVVNNAMEAMPGGGILTLKTRTENRSDQPYVIIDVADTGVGMPVDAMRGTGPTKGNGRGFGLLIAHDMIKRCNGYVEVLSAKDRGTTVRFCLPSETVL